MKSEFNPLALFFRVVSNILNGAERSMLDFVSIIIPWMVPVIPAYLTFFHTVDPGMMNFPPWVAWTAAFVVEALGLVSVATAIRFWYYNVRYKDVKKHAPFRLAVAVYVVYIVIVIVVNVILEIVSGARSGWIITAIALFSLLSFPSGVLISIRAQFGEMLEARTRQATTGQNEAPARKERKPKYASAYKDRIVEMLDQSYEQSGAVMPLTVISKRLNLDHAKSKGFISTVRKKWANEKGIKSDKPIGF